MPTTLSVTNNTSLYPGHTSGEWNNNDAFAMIKEDGSVITWGTPGRGGSSSTVAAQLNGAIDVTQIYSTSSAFAALRSDGSVVTWGLYGGDSYSVAAQLDGTIDVIEIYSTSKAFAALHSDGSVVTWGDANYGGNSNTVAGQLDGTIDVIEIYSTSSAFAALRSDGSVVTWGYYFENETEITNFGGDSSAVAAQIDGTVDVTQICSTNNAFAALRSDGSVVTWGEYVFFDDVSQTWITVNYGGDSSAVAVKLNGTIDVTNLYSTQSAFAALRSDGSVVTWGLYGGDSYSVAAQLNGTIDVIEIYSAGGAFAALRSDGSVVTWGGGQWSGADSSAVSAQLSGTIDVIDICSSASAFAALRIDGSVVTWGSPGMGGNSSAVAAQLNGTIDVIEIYSTGGAFAALRSDGSVVTWGESQSGGDSSAVAAQLNGTIDVIEIYTTGGAFAALRSDGSVVTWGYHYGGYDSHAVAAQLTSGMVSGANILTDDVAHYPDDLTIDGSPNDDVLNGDTGSDTLKGFGGNDTLNGLASNDNLDGGGGNDTLNGGTGNDTMLGGFGNDTYFVDTAGDMVTEELDQGADTVKSAINYVLGANFENLILIGSAAINAFGNSLNNTLIGNGANNDLRGNVGVDTMKGGLGNDTYSVDDKLDKTIEFSGEGTDTVISSITWTLAANIENLVLSGASAINASGNGLGNTLTGNSANNILNGLAGNDTMIGWSGNDTYIVNDTDDVVTEQANQGIDTVKSSISYTLGSNVEKLILTGNAAINGTGNELINTLTGNGGNNTLDGGLGSDKLVGGLGNDTYYVDATGDVVTELANAGIDTICSSVTRTLGANQENLTLTGTAAINGTGNTLANTLIGNDANNVLNGGLGNDTLTGGGGKDFFLFDSALNANVDTIKDFVAIDDTIRLDQTIFTSLTALGTLAGTGCFRSSATGLAVDANDYILYKTSSGALFYDADGNGAGVATQFAILENKPAITAGDFVVVA